MLFCRRSTVDRALTSGPIRAASVEANLDASLNFELQAYGLHIVNTTIDLCSLVAGLLCPLPQYDFVGSATIPLSQAIGGDINLPGIAYWIPNLDASANSAARPVPWLASCALTKCLPEQSA